MGCNRREGWNELSLTLPFLPPARHPHDIDSPFFMHDVRQVLP